MEEGESVDPGFVEVQACFFQKVPTKIILREKSDWLKTFTTGDQDKLLKMTIASDTCRDYPVAVEYQQKFLKGWIQLLEDSGVEISDMLYECYGDLISSRELGEKLNYKTFMFGGGSTLILEEATMMLSHGTTGLSIWPAAYWLAEWVLENGHVFSNKSVLELGCGVGFTGLVACMACQIDQYVFTDWHHKVLQSLHRNLRLNLREKKTCPCAALCEQCSAIFENSGEEILEASCAMVTVSGGIPNGVGQNCGTTLAMDNSNGMSENLTPSDVDQHQRNLCDFQMNNASYDESKSSLGSDSSCCVPRTVDNKACRLRDRTPRSLCSHSDSAQFGSGDEPDADEVNSGAGTAYEPSADGNSRNSTVVHLASLDWEQEVAEVTEYIQPDVILAADVIFEPKLIPPLTRTLKHFLCRSERNVAFIASSVRNQETYGQFVEELAVAGIASEELTGRPPQVFHYDRSSCPIKLLRLHSS